MSCLLNFSTTGECFFSLLVTLSLLLSLLLSELTPSLLVLSLATPLSSPPDELDEEEDSCTNFGASSRTSEEDGRLGFRPFLPFLCDDDDDDEAASTLDLASKEELAELAAAWDFDELCSVTRAEEEEDSLSLEEVSGLLFSHPDDAEELAMDFVGLNAGIVFTSFLF